MDIPQLILKEGGSLREILHPIFRLRGFHPRRIAIDDGVTSG